MGAMWRGLSVEGEVLECAPFLKFRWRPAGGEWQEVQTGLIGAYNMQNLLAAATIGRTFGVEVDAVNRALAAYEPKNNRSQLTETDDNKLLVDAYNANPTSMRAAIENFRDMKVERRMAILGDMVSWGTAVGKPIRPLPIYWWNPVSSMCVGGAEVQGGASSFPYVW